MPIICEGCGQRLPIPEGYRRNKIQCACGVINTVPESARQKADAPTPKKTAATTKPTAAIEEQAERWLLDEDVPAAESASEPPTFDDPAPNEEAAPARKPSVAEMRFPCRRCGRLVRRQGECPDCNTETMAATTSAEPVWWPGVDAPADKDAEEDNSSPYAVEGADDVKCPKCCLMLPPASVLCIRCGFHLKKRKKIVKTYQPIERAWETNSSYQKRLLIFWSCTATFLGLGLFGVFQGEAALGVFLVSFAVVTAMLAFLVGTFTRIQLTRDARGRVQLTKMWRAAFFARRPQTIDVRGYEGIVGGRHRDVGTWDMWMFLFLFGFGIVPGIIWWYCVYYKVTYHVSLSQDHGFPAYLVYSGWSEMQMKEIAYALRDASGLNYDEG